MSDHIINLESVGCRMIDENERDSEGKDIMSGIK